MPGRITPDGATGRTPGVFVTRTPVAKRHRWRLACEIVSDGRSQRAIVLDLSGTGLFVQTGTRLPPGAEVEVRVLLRDGAESTALRARVVRNKQVPPQLTSVARGGVGLKILDAPAAFYETIAALEGSDTPRQPAASATPQPAKTRFRVRIKQADGPRSRSVEILADSADDARALALAQVGAGWETVGADVLG